MAENRISLTRHAALMLAERSIERAWVDLTIADPEYVEQDPIRDNVFRAFRSIAEREGRILRVVYTFDNNELRVITAFFDRARRQ